MTLLPWRSSARALFRTSKAVSVPSRDMRRARCSSCWVVGAMGKTPQEANGTLYARRRRHKPLRTRRFTKERDGSGSGGRDHQGQNATRLRELGGVPPMTDFIVRLKDGQPAA